MFEKEAEEWVKENMDCCKTDNSVNQSIPYFDEEERCCAKSAFQDGAEFGYNKANEWRYMKDVLPEKGKYVLVCTKYENVYVARLVKDTYFINKKGGFVQTSDVIAWKEIVLPKEIK